MRAAEQAEGEALAALRRVEAARAAEVETLRRRLADARGRRRTSEPRPTRAARRLAEAEAGVRRAADGRAGRGRGGEGGRGRARSGPGGARLARGGAPGRGRAGRVDGQQGGELARPARSASAHAWPRRRRAASQRQRRRLGGRPLADGLEVEAGFRVAVEAALGEAMRGYVVGREGVLGLDGQRGTLVLENGEGTGGGPAARGAVRRRARAAERTGERAAERRPNVWRRPVRRPSARPWLTAAGRLADAIRVDPGGAASRLLARSVWVPDLGAALAVQPRLAAGWIAVTRDGAVVTAAGVVTMGRSESLLDRRAELERLGEEVARLEMDARAAAAEAATAAQSAAAARAALDAARDAERRAGAARREAEEAERRAARALEKVAREAAWRSAQAAAPKPSGNAWPPRCARPSRPRVRAGTRWRSGPAPFPAGPLRARPLPPAEQASALREWEARAALAAGPPRRAGGRRGRARGRSPGGRGSPRPRRRGRRARPGPHRRAGAPDRGARRA